MAEKKKHSALVYNLGGTISCNEYVDDDVYDSRIHKNPKRVEIRPQRGRIRDLIQQHVDKDTVNLFDGLNFQEARTLKDSAEYRVADLMRIVKTVRELLAEHKSNILITAGTDSSASLTHALAEGVPPQLLQTNSLIVAVSNEHVSEKNPATNKHPAIVSLTNSLYLLTRDKIRGRIGVCTGITLHSPRGLQKISTTGEPLMSRFPAIAKANDKPVPDWFYSDSRAYQQPRGKPHDYVLSPGVEDLVLGPSTEYENIRYMLKGAIDQPELDGRSSKMRGLIIQAPGTANLVQNRRELKYLEESAEYAREKGIPVVLIADPLQREEVSWSTNDENKGYGGSFAIIEPALNEASSSGKTSILNGGKLTRTEAQLLTSAAVARAREQHELEGSDIVNYVEKYLLDYQRLMVDTF